jgi:hypothetical protein
VSLSPAPSAGRLLSIPQVRACRPPPAPESVELGRFELPTSRVQGGRSPTKLQPRVRGLPHAGAALGTGCPVRARVGVPGIEPGTSVLSGLRSNRLSYTPKTSDLNRRRVKGRRGRYPVPSRGSEPIDLGVASGPREGPRGKLPRKEVIQPHLPVRLPCYDFVPIAGSAFDGAAPEGFRYRLQAYPTFMT